MSFELFAYRAGATPTVLQESLCLSDSAPYKLETLEDAGPATVARFGQTSPDQHGITDLGYRLQPRTLKMVVLFVDGDDQTGGGTYLTDRRDYLMSTFRPSRTVNLHMVRDDDEERILECHTLSIEVDLVPEHYPARLNRAVITLRAAQPAWYTVTAKSATFARSGDWVTGDGAIPVGNVMENGNYPTQGQAWEFTSSLVNTWSIVIRSGSVPAAAGTAVTAAYHAGSAALGTATLASKDIRLFSTNGNWYMGTGYAFSGTTTMPAGTHNYIQTYSGSATQTWRNYKGTALEATNVQHLELISVGRRWRSQINAATATFWPEELPYYALYNIELDATQRAALNDAINADVTSETLGTVTAVNDGDLYAFPIITLRGPMVNPVLTNLATDDVIDLTGISITTGQTYTLDLRDGHKTFENLSGSSLVGSMGTPVQLAAWALAPSPIASGGTNLIRVAAGSMTTDTLVTVTHYDLHMGF